MSLKLYLAGPEVFMPNARELLDQKAFIAREEGFIPLSPGDLSPPKSESRFETAVAISRINERMMREADVLVANLTPFRGLAADVGTSFEVGYMCALGKLTYGYSNVAKSHFERVSDYYGGAVVLGEDGRHRGPDGISLEDFEMSDNLMLDGGLATYGGGFYAPSETVAPEALYTDMTAYRKTLRLILIGLASGRRAASSVCREPKLKVQSPCY
jgi:nucleoside 2-deoxyribosyltransferase